MDTVREDLGGTSCLTAELQNNRPHMQTAPPMQHHQQPHQLMQPAPMQGAWCAGCNGPITEQFLLQAVDRCWHTRCLKCHHCSIPLSDLGPSCYAKGGMILCRTDYIRLFGSHGTCAGCSMHIPATEFVLRSSSSSSSSGGGGRVYHVQCFVCSQCRCPLQTGDRYALLPNGLPVCETDFAKAFATASSASSGGSATATSGGGGGQAAATASGTSKRGGGKKKGGGGGGGGGGGQKQQPPLQPVC